MIQVKNLSKSFMNDKGPKLAVQNVSFELEPTDILAFLGPNGAGKSTTMKMMTGFLGPDSGSVTYGSLDITKHPIACQKHIGYVPENAPLYQEMTVREFLEFCADLRGLDSQKKKERMEIVLSSCKIKAVEDERIENLSKGYKRRVSIAQALIHDPQFLILDEPTDGLDPNQKHDVRGLLKELSQMNKTIIISTHILEEVEAICNKVVLIAGGQVKFSGDLKSFKSQGADLNQIFRRLTSSTEEVVHA